MLTTFLDKLGTLYSRQFVVSYFIPVLLFAGLNALLVAWHSPAFRVWLPIQLEGAKALYALPLLLVLAVLAFVVSSVTVFLRQVLEGRRLLPKRVSDAWAQAERARRDQIESRYRNARNDFNAVKRRKSLWQKELDEASEQGHKTPVAGAIYDTANPAAMHVEDLRAKREALQAIPAAELETAVTHLVTVLNTMSRGGAGEDARRLNDDYRAILEIFDYAQGMLDGQTGAALTEWQTRFALDELPRPTRMGNIAAALDTYAQTRYGMNLSVYWNRMQPALQANKDFYALLADAKGQLDFLVMCFWLCIFTIAGWIAVMPWLPFSWLFFGLVCLAGPLLARLFYLLAVENYMVMAELVKSAVDLFRFQLIKSLHLPQPGGLRQERALWTSLSKLDQDALEISYHHDVP